MSWGGRLLEIPAGDPAAQTSGLGRLAGPVERLIEEQTRGWPQLAAGRAALAGVQTRPVHVRRSTFILQHNPGRIRNTTADVAAAVAGRRPCFLCPADLPPEEKGVTFGEDFVILCNPFPILDRHLSIVHRDHIPQRVDGRLGALVELAEALGPTSFVLYNGPRCGASAPDHLHFQACARDRLPIEQDVERRWHDGGRSSESEGVAVLRPDEHGRTVIVLRARQRRTLVAWMEEVVASLPSDTEEEPLLNLICTADAASFTACVFPRARHRPAAYFGSGDDRLLLSPGAIDMAGVVVLPERRDFERLDASTVAAVFQEVSLPAERLASLPRSCPAPPA